jgi:NAD-dependent deacetylase
MMSIDLQQKIDRARNLIQHANALVAFTGAGISTPSGIPDFRSKGTGLWEQNDPMEVASLTTFRHHPERFWGWKRPLMCQIWKSSPNPAHLALAQLEMNGQLKAIVTQNIDGLHQRAGSRNVFELHGTIESMTCTTCRSKYASLEFKSQLEDEQIPHCPKCGVILKPDVVLFEEMLPQDVWRAAEKYCLRADIMLVVGSSLEVWPAANLPDMAASNGARVIVVNLSPTFLDARAEVVLPMDVAVALPMLAGM